MLAVVLPDDELRDLTKEDALELRAFVEKQKWFEGKLQVRRATILRGYR